MNRSQYRQIAKKHKIPMQKMKRDMQDAVDAAYITPTFHARCVYCKGATPTVDEFIDHSVRRIAARP